MESKKVCFLFVAQLPPRTSTHWQFNSTEWFLDEPTQFQQTHHSWIIGIHPSSRAPNCYSNITRCRCNCETYPWYMFNCISWIYIIYIYIYLYLCNHAYMPPLTVCPNANNIRHLGYLLHIKSQRFGHFGKVSLLNHLLRWGGLLM